ncbi:hypothetical protein LPJ38_01760 [Bradyrhizobium daqingense]|uniref:hypothetical protein n=1 Tax=Bradyrhizobium daqingense TaxID=993502 RepID=UPI00119E3D19|nr:hypothetical protein [Bradyrhizobium daqingense]UFS89543.1 hypothetical protein LPJ38_01760 [Bradyrhizobium daqingense]
MSKPRDDRQKDLLLPGLELAHLVREVSEELVFQGLNGGELADERMGQGLLFERLELRMLPCVNPGGVNGSPGELEKSWLRGRDEPIELLDGPGFGNAGADARPEHPQQDIALGYELGVDGPLGSASALRPGMGFPPNRQQDDAFCKGVLGVPVIYYLGRGVAFAFLGQVGRGGDEYPEDLRVEGHGMPKNR